MVRDMRTELRTLANRCGVKSKTPTEEAQHIAHLCQEAAAIWDETATPPTDAERSRRTAALRDILAGHLPMEEVRKEKTRKYRLRRIVQAVKKIQRIAAMAHQGWKKAADKEIARRVEEGRPAQR